MSLEAWDDEAKTIKNVREAAKALADLNLFASLVALLESGLNSSATFRAADKIIIIAKDEQQKCLRRYDAACDKLISYKESLNGTNAHDIARPAWCSATPHRISRKTNS